MPSNADLPARGAALLLALVAALLLFRLGDVPLLGPDEPRYARVAVEMHRRGDWVVPTLSGAPWLEKPPLYYWLAGAGFSVLGEGETAARLPSVLAAVILTGLTALVGARLYGGSAGLHAGFVAGLALLSFVYGRAASMDMLLAAAVTAAVGLVGLRALGIAGPLAMFAAGICAGVGMLAKGPLGALLPGLVAVVFLALVRGQAWRRVAPGLVPAAVAAAVVAGPWYAAILHVQGRAFVDVFLLGHNVARFTSTIHHHPGPLWYYVPFLLGGVFVWSGLVFPALAAVSRRDPRDLFVLVWLAAPLVFFSAAASKLPGYILPCVPPLAILAGRAADGMVTGTVGAGWRRAVGLVTVVLAAVVVAVPIVAARMGEPAWSLLVPPAAWALLTALGTSSRLARDAGGALRILRVGAAGFLLLLTSAVPPILAARESGRDLFLPARGREVLVWNAWRTAWMAGYFYNDGRVREVAGLDEIAVAAAHGGALVLCGPGELRALQSLPGVVSRVLTRGPRGQVLVRVQPRLVARPSS